MHLSVADASADRRAAFVRRTYMHLAGAILALIVLEAALFQTAIPGTFVGLLGTSRDAWLIMMSAFMGISYLGELRHVRANAVCRAGTVRGW